MTNQQVFDKVLEHSRQMTEKCEIEIANIKKCMYRGKDGNKCFVGALIPDEIYNPSIEEHDAENAIDILFLFDKFQDHNLLDALQIIHDSKFDNREEELMKLASIWGLTYTPLTQN